MRQNFVVSDLGSLEICLLLSGGLEETTWKYDSYEAECWMPKSVLSTVRDASIREFGKLAVSSRQKFNNFRA
jgi:hypothetical protein